MRVLTINELMRLTRIELCDLACADHERLPGLPAKARRNGKARVINLRNIRAVLARRDFAP